MRGSGQDADQDPTRTRRLTVSQAAEALGVSLDAVRARVKRGTLDVEREGGRVWVILDTDQGADQHIDQEVDRLVEALRDEIAPLRRESERKDTIIVSLSQSNAELSRTIRAIEAPETPESPVPTPMPRPDPYPFRPPRRAGDRHRGAGAPILVAEDVRVPTALIGLLGVVLGAVLGAAVSYFLQKAADERRWKREDERLYHPERIAAYKAFAREVTPYTMARDAPGQFDALGEYLVDRREGMVRLVRHIPTPTPSPRLPSRTRQDAYSM